MKTTFEDCVKRARADLQRGGSKEGEDPHTALLRLLRGHCEAAGIEINGLTTLKSKTDTTTSDGDSRAVEKRDAAVVP